MALGLSTWLFKKSFIYAFVLFIILSTAQFDSSNDAQFEGQTLTCPSNQACTVRCDKSDACRTANIKCDPNRDCSIECANTAWDDYDSCRNAIIDCPTNSNKKCSVQCSSGSFRRGCRDLFINWNVGSAQNTLKCDESCENVPYPPPINDNTPFIVSCDENEECYGTIITCPKYSICTIQCSGTDSCTNAVINCPSTAMCSVTCLGTTSCESTTINWESAALSQFACINNCDGANFPPLPVPTDNSQDFNLVCDGSSVNCHAATITCAANAVCTVECSGTDSCKAATIRCPASANCNIQCSGSNSCENAKVICPPSGPCSVSCNANSACKNADIRWRNGAPNNIECGSFDSSCWGVHFKPYRQSIAWTQDCSKAANMCRGATFDCPQDASCTINCQGVSQAATGACQEAIINGPIGHPLTVTCNQGYACHLTKFYASESSYFSLDCMVDGTYTCTSQTIYFPPNVGGTKMATIQGRDDSFSLDQEFYAINGWRDVNIIYGGIWAYHNGTMHCNLGYSQSCSFDDESFSCSTCDDPILPTTDPSPHPTRFPTENPTPSPTDQPTLVPTANPTPAPTSNPTAMPTHTTMIPTKDPTKSPSLIPTVSPSNNPSKAPTNIPSTSPTEATNNPTPSPTLLIGVDIPTPTPKPTNHDDSANGETTSSPTKIGEVTEVKQEIVLNNDNRSNQIVIWVVVALFCSLFNCVILIVFVLRKRKNTKSTADETNVKSMQNENMESVKREESDESMYDNKVETTQGAAESLIQLNVTSGNNVRRKSSIESMYKNGNDNDVLMLNTQTENIITDNGGATTQTPDDNDIGNV